MPKTTLLDQTTLLVQIRSGLKGLADGCDVLDATNMKSVGMVAHESAGLSNFLRPYVGNGLVTTVVNVYDPGVSLPILSVSKKAFFKGGGYEIRGALELVYARGRAEVWSLGAAIDFVDGFGGRLGALKGVWKDGTFTFTLADKSVLGIVTRSSPARNAPTTVSVHPEATHPRAMPLMLGAALALDLALKGRK